MSSRPKPIELGDTDADRPPARGAKRNPLHQRGPARRVAAAALARWGERLPLAGTVVGASTLVVGAIANLVGIGLGAPQAPFWVLIGPLVSWYVVPAAVLLALGVAAAPRLTAPSVGPAGFAAAVLGLTLVLRLTLNATRFGPAGWYRIFGDAWEAQYEYLPALSALRLGARTFLDRFAEFSASLSIHPSAHPPGLLLLLDALEIRTAPAMAALTIGVGALSAPLVYVLGRRLLDEARGRVAALFFVLAPSSLLYGATSADALYCTLGLVAATALVSRRRLVAAVGPALLALATFFSYALAGVGAWVVLVVARRRGVRRALVLAASCAVVVVGAYAVLYALTGFDLPGSLDAANSAYVRGIAGERPYWYWLFGSPTAFFVALGLPLAWLVLRGAGRGEPMALALVAVIAAATIMGFTKAENERIWLFLVPLACVAAAAQHRRSTTTVLAALAVQALVVQVLINTRW